MKKGTVMKKVKKQKPKKAKSDDLVAIALRQFAGIMAANPERFTREEGKALDRALRSSKSIGGIDVVWCRWVYIAEQQGWLTSDELQFDGKGYFYPEGLVPNPEDC
jgi:hypothetical protein